MFEEQRENSRHWRVWIGHVEEVCLNFISFEKCKCLNIFKFEQRNHVPLSQQVLVFKAQLKMASETGKPIVIHCRNTEEQVFNLLKQVKIYSLLGI
jgi:hypothetical protein